jgi:hypothetical protein
LKAVSNTITIRPNNQSRIGTGVALGFFLLLEFHQDLAHAVGQLRAVAEFTGHFQQHAGHQAADQHRHGNRRHDGDELDEVPLGNGGDQQVLGFPDQGAHTAQGCTHSAVHQ